MPQAATDLQEAVLSELPVTTLQQLFGTVGAAPQKFSIRQLHSKNSDQYKPKVYKSMDRQIFVDLANIDFTGRINPLPLPSNTAQQLIRDCSGLTGDLVYRQPAVTPQGNRVVNRRRNREL